MKSFYPNKITQTILLFYILLSFQLNAQVESINVGLNRGGYDYITTIGKFNPKDCPATRTYKQISWISADNIYLYGSTTYAQSSGASSFWVYNTTIKQWKCIQTSSSTLSYGTKGVFSPTNNPGNRLYGIPFVDAAGNLYLYGGNANNELWKFDITLQQWAWIGGYNTTTNNNGLSGAIGVESPDYIPSRYISGDAVLGDDGMIYLYGAYTVSVNSSTYNVRNELWRYNPTNNQWSVIYKNNFNTGSISSYTLGQNVGQVGVESPSNCPGMVSDYFSCFANNCVWLFEGYLGIPSTSVDSFSNKVWKYNLSSSQWTCVKAPNTIAAIYGTAGVSDNNNHPSILNQTSNGLVINNEVYFLGGYEPGGTTTDFSKGFHNSLWKFNLTTYEWTWLKGSQKTCHPGFYGRKHVERPENMPSSRLNSLLWSDNGNIKVFGGKIFANNTPNDGNTTEIWKYNVATNNFTWEDGRPILFYNIQTALGSSYIEDYNVPSVYNYVGFPTSMFWGGKGEKVWFINTEGMWEYDVANSTNYRIIEDVYNNVGNYGTLGVPSPSNFPPYRENATVWETNNNLYLMGGNSTVTGQYDDFWIFDKATKIWTWIGGVKTNETPNFFYPNIGEINSNSFPKTKYQGHTWVDMNENLWLYSGVNRENYYTNDLWMYDTGSNTWILKGGSSANCTTTTPYFLPNYPPYMQNGTTWSKGNDLYLFGGTGLGKSGTTLWNGKLTDVWKYNIPTNSWSLISGNRKIDNNANYGLKSYGFPSNLPSARRDYASFSDDYGNLWIYGGYGKGDSGSATSNLFDLWKFDTTINTWIWVDGIKNPLVGTENIFHAYDYNFPDVTSQYSKTYNGIGKRYLFNNPGIWEFDLAAYGRDYNIIQGNVRYNENNNCVAGDNPVPNFKLKINQQNDNLFFSNQQGFYKIFTPYLNNALDVIGLPNPYYSYSPATTSINFPDFDNTVIQDFCVSPNGTHNDVDITIVPLTVARPGANATYKIIYKNKGSVPASGTIQFNYNDSIENFVSASISPDTQNTGQLIWNYTNLLPFDIHTITVTIHFNNTLDVPPVNLNDIVSFSGVINPIPNDESPLDNLSSINQTVVNSHDPNDKTCLQGTSIEATEIGQFVYYMIRFQNLGTANANIVSIRDVIDTYKFDINSIETIDSSHPYRMLISNTNMLEYIFENINLPYGTTNPLSNGYVVFKIKTLATLQPNDTFSNGAQIFFDYNAAVNTNTYTTTIATLSNSAFYESKLVLYPNPVKDTVHIESKLPVTKIEVYDIMGRIIASLSIEENEANFDFLKTGTYFLKVYCDTELKVIKIIKE